MHSASVTVAAACRAKGAIVDAGAIDVVDRAALAARLVSIDDAHPVDWRVIANAGISIGQGQFLSTTSVVRKTLDVNVGGVLNTVEPGLATQ